MKTASITAWWQNIRTLVCGLYIIDRSGSSELETSRTLPVKHDSTAQDQFFSSWKLLSIVNILLVASAGVLLRAKILFPIPWLHHKFLLHAHSHFAFSGWLGQLLSVLIIQLLIRSVEIDLKKIRILFILNAFASYGMLFTFPFMGYAGPSIFFSTISMLYSIVFPIVTLTYINRSNLSSLTKNCFRLSLGSQIISAAGPIALGLSMIQKIQSTNIEVKAVYWFLHFQYNGFFFFAICGLFCSSLSNYWQKSKYLQIAFILFAFSLVPAYLLKYNGSICRGQCKRWHQFRD